MSCGRYATITPKNGCAKPSRSPSSAKSAVWRISRACCGAGVGKGNAMKGLNDLMSGMGAASRGSMQTSSNGDDLPASGPCSICGLADSICGGLGMVRYDVPVGGQRCGKMLRGPNFPVERDTERQTRLRELSNLGALSDKHFEDFITDAPAYTPAEQQSLRLALNKS